MGLFRIEMDHAQGPTASKENTWPALEKFLTEMDADRSSFFHLPVKSDWDAELAKNQAALATRIPNVSHFVHMGIGGSSLGAETIVNALAPPTAPRFQFLDNIDPDVISDLLEYHLSPSVLSQTLFYVVTKSGTTMETLAQFACLFNWVQKKIGIEAAKKHFVFCTDPEQGNLRELGNEWGIPTFSIPENLGGRFSALSAVGLLPALVSGIDCNSLLKGAAEFRTSFLEDVKNGNIPPIADLAYRLFHHYHHNRRNITVLMPYSQKLKTLSAWFTQLWAESLGKNGKGMTPLAATGATDQHSILQLLRDGPQDKVVGFIEISGFHKVIELRWENHWSKKKLSSLEAVTGITLNQLMDAEFNATREVMTRNSRPHFTLVLPKLNANTLGQLLFSLETLTAMAGYLMEINPFDQPGVEEGKQLTHERIRACKKSTMN